MGGANKGNVIDLRGTVEAGVAADRGLELAGEIGIVGIADIATLDLFKGRGAVNDLVLGGSGHWRSQEPTR